MKKKGLVLDELSSVDDVDFKKTSEMWAMYLELSRNHHALR